MGTPPPHQAPVLPGGHEGTGGHQILPRSSFPRDTTKAHLVPATPRGSLFSHPLPRAVGPGPGTSWHSCHRPPSLWWLHAALQGPSHCRVAPRAGLSADLVCGNSPGPGCEAARHSTARHSRIPTPPPFRTFQTGLIISFGVCGCRGQKPCLGSMLQPAPGRLYLQLGAHLLTATATPGGRK